MGAAQQASWLLMPAESTITYFAKHPLHRWSGENSKLKGIAKLQEGEALPSQLAIIATVRDFDSQNENRDAHALEVLDALDFPDVKFFVINLKRLPRIALCFKVTSSSMG